MALTKKVFFFWIFLQLNKIYLQKLIFTSQIALKLILCLISPYKWQSIPTFIWSNIKIPPTSVAYIMNELIFGFSIVTVRMFSISSFWEGKGFLFGRADLFEAMNTIVTQKTAIYVVDIRISTCSIGLIVNNIAWNWNNSICLHLVKIII